MDISTTMTSMQVFLIWMLMGLLLTWMIVFGLLALKPERRRKVESEPLSSLSGSFPQLHVLVQQQAEKPVGGIQIESTAASSSSSRI